jgi:hypothetical protein
MREEFSCTGGDVSINVKVRTGVEWVNKFHAGGCNQANLDYCDDQAEGFYNEMGNHGHTKVFDWGDDNAWETDFRQRVSVVVGIPQTGRTMFISASSMTTAATGETFSTLLSRKATTTV